MSKKQKILVCGDVEGNFKTLFSRVNTVNEKNGPFDFLFCVGDFFSDSLEKLEPYKNGTLKVSVPTFILGPNKKGHVAYYEDASGCEICPNVHYLGKYGIYSSNGLKIAYLSGVEAGKTASEFSFTEKEASAVYDAATRRSEGGKLVGVDLLLTSEWPKGVGRLDTKGPPSSEEGSVILSRLACRLKPRYHFSGLNNVFYERPPYRNCASGEDSYAESHRTRFIGLAKVGNVGKNKWLYAANLTPLTEIKDEELYQRTTDETECPYVGLAKQNDHSSGTQFFYDLNAPDDDRPRKKRKHNDGDKSKARNFDDPDTCWFCLASASVEKHLVISIGEEMYLAGAKGGLSSRHVMIVPVKHHRSQIDLSSKATDEIKKYKSALRKFFSEKNEVPVVFERNFKTSHLQLHVVPVPRRLSDNLKDVFMSFAAERDIDLSEIPRKGHLKDFVQPGTPYFYVELPNKEKLLCSCRKDFPIQFGRDVLASESVLDVPEMVNWRDCVKSKEEEQKIARDFRSEFEPFDDVS